ncbi:MAG: glycoside hydrolase family 13 protein [Verrucomicrobiae bacterium]|nr:glycoside hydrolase family 13 protein [Verrucomicrobiae bacterium]
MHPHPKNILLHLLLCSIFRTMPASEVPNASPTPPDFPVPDWAKDAIWYQIFPERFYNGDPSNDPTLDSLAGAYPDDTSPPWQIHPWTSDWYALQPHEKAHPDRPLFHHILRRRYGGDLQGILQKLDYLADLGINAIYLNPIFHSPSHHKYDALSYHHVDPHFGPDPAGDLALIAKETFHDPSTWSWTAADRLFLHLLQQAKKRNIRIILDGVFNHLGKQSPPFQDLLKNQRLSPYRDWFIVESWRDDTTGTPFTYRGWFGHDTLPEILEIDDNIAPAPRQYIFHATRRWMDPDGDGDPSDGIDGWRLDVAFCIPHGFWKQWRRLVKSINPQAYLTAEIIDPPEKLLPYLQGDEFDAVMNYNFAFACAAFFLRDDAQALTPTAFLDRLAHLRRTLPPSVAYVMQNLFGSHDTNRLASHAVNRNLGHYHDWPTYFQQSKATNPAYLHRPPNPHEKRLIRLLTLFQFTYIGAPMIYYGDEVGLHGANDPCCRKPMLWPEYTYEPETYLPDGTRRPTPDPIAPDLHLHRHYRTLAHLRHRHPSLRRGTFEVTYIDDATRTFAFQRKHHTDTLTVAFNTSKQPVTLPLSKIQAPSSATILYTVGDARLRRPLLILPPTLTLAPHSATILKSP